MIEWVNERQACIINVNWYYFNDFRNRVLSVWNFSSFVFSLFWNSHFLIWILNGKIVFQKCVKTSRRFFESWNLLEKTIIWSNFNTHLVKIRNRLNKYLFIIFEFTLVSNLLQKVPDLLRPDLKNNFKNWKNLEKF